MFGGGLLCPGTRDVSFSTRPSAAAALVAVNERVEVLPQVLLLKARGPAPARELPAEAGARRDLVLAVLVPDADLERKCNKKNTGEFGQTMSSSSQQVLI